MQSQQQFMRGQVEKKQRYLRENILDCNYDPQQFAEFCERVIGNVQIEVWTFTSLENTVKMFVDSKHFQNRLEGSSFMNYQQELSEDEQVDIDNIDVSTNRRGQSGQLRVELISQDNPFKIIPPNVCDGIVRGLKNPKQQSSIWGPESEAMVGIDSYDVDIDMGFQGGSSSIQNSSGNFGDFSTPSSQEIDPVQSNNGHTTEPLCRQLQKPSLRVTNSDYNYTASQGAFKKTDQLGTGQLSDYSRLVTKTSMPLFNKPVIQTVQSLSLTQPYTPALVKKYSVPETTLKSRLKSESGFVKETFSDVVCCAKANVRTLLNDPKLSVQVSGHEVVSGSYLLPSHVLYSISVKPMNLQVKRKYTYFLWLRTLLGKFYPGVRFPYLDKGVWISETNSDFIKLQKLGIQGFMNDLLMNPEFRNCRVVEQFLTIKDPSDLKLKFADYEKMAKIRAIEQMCLLKGSVKVSYTNEHYLYFEKLPSLLQSLEANFGKYKTLNQKLNGLYNSLITTYTDMEEAFVSIQTSLRAFGTTVDHTFPSLEFGIQALNDHYRQLNTNVRLESKLSDREFKSLWSYQINNLRTIRELLDIRVKMTDAYLKSHSDNIPKSQLYTGNKKLQQSKHALDQPSKNPNILRYQMAFYNEASLAQTSRMLDDLGRKILKVASVGVDRYQGRTRDSLDFYRTQKKAVRSVTLSTG